MGRWTGARLGACAWGRGGGQGPQERSGNEEVILGNPGLQRLETLLSAQEPGSPLVRPSLSAQELGLSPSRSQRRSWDPGQALLLAQELGSPPPVKQPLKNRACILSKSQHSSQ